MFEISVCPLLKTASWLLLMVDEHMFLLSIKDLPFRKMGGVLMLSPTPKLSSARVIQHLYVKGRKSS